jgi:hypothetical protein
MKTTSKVRATIALPWRRRRAPVLFALAFATVLFVGLVGRSALAAGNFSIKTTEVSEGSGEWHIKVRIDLARAPSMMHTPMRFTFSKEAVDERAIMSKGAEPVHHRMVLDVPPKQIQSLDVDFADASGKVFKSTYFEFDLRRDSGYFEAGEYLVTLSGPDGDVGSAQKLTLKGDNPPVYRGAMDFSADPKASKTSKQKGPRIEAVSSGLDGGAQKVASNDDPSSGGGGGSSAAPSSTDVSAEGDAPSMIPKGAFNKTAEEEGVKDHPRGCGCVAVGRESGPLAGLGGSGLASLAILTWARRRRRGRRQA